MLISLSGCRLALAPTRNVTQDRGASDRCQERAVRRDAAKSRLERGGIIQGDETGREPITTRRPHGRQGRSAGEAVRDEGAGGDGGARSPERRRLEEGDLVREMDGRRRRASPG